MLLKLAKIGSVDPFEGKYIDGLIYGRGACDMKGGIAASIIAVECFVAVSPNYSGKN